MATTTAQLAQAASMQAAAQPAYPAGGYAVDVTTDPWFTGQLGSGAGSYDFSQVNLPGMDSFYTRASGSGDGMQDARLDSAAFSKWLKDNGYSYMEARPDDRSYTRWIQDGAGNVIAAPQSAHEDGKFLRDAALVIGAGYYGGNALSGAYGSGAAAATGGMEAAATTGATTGATAGSGITGAAYGAADVGALGGGSLLTGGAGVGGTTATTAATTGASSMAMGDWIQLANLGAGLWAANQAGDRADANAAMSGALAQQQLAFSREAFDWYKAYIEKQQPTIDAAAERAGKISDAQLEAMNFATGQAKELDQYNKTTFRPIEQRLASEAMTYDTPERRMQAAASAAADVDVSAAATRQATDRALARAGVAPGTTKAMALREDAALGQSVARGGAMTNAVRNVEQQGYARMADAAALGKGVVSSQATQQQIATGSGSASVSAAGQGVQFGQAPVATMNSGVSAYLNGTNSAGNLFRDSANAANDEYAALLSGMQGIGRFIGQRYGS